MRTSGRGGDMAMAVFPVATLLVVGVILSGGPHQFLNLVNDTVWQAVTAVRAAVGW